MSEIYTATREKASKYRFSPRRRHYAEALAEYLTWRGGRIYFNSSSYADMRRHWSTGQMTRQQVDDAADDLHMLGWAELIEGRSCWIMELTGGAE